MSLAEAFRRVLDSQGTFHDDQREVLAADGPRRLVCRLCDLDRLACGLQALRLETAELADASIERLRSLGEALSGRLTYLLEPIAPIEVDAESCTVQLRSSPPHREDDQTSYYELVVRRGGSIGLQRFRAASGQQREPIAAQLTREVLLRLVGDLDAVLD